jgi:hypothetical protein
MLFGFVIIEIDLFVGGKLQVGRPARGRTAVRKAIRGIRKAGVNFNNILQAVFFVQKCFLQLFSISSLALLFLKERISAQKLLIKCW